MTRESKRLRALLANEVRHHGSGPEVDRLVRELRAARAEEYVRALIEGRPAPTLIQRARLALVLLGGEAA